MTNLYGRPWKREELLARTGGMEQLAGIELVELADGAARGVRAANLRTGTGLEVQVLLDRALDIGRACYRGQNLACRAPSGVVHPAFYDPQGAHWLRTFGCGLLTTCGLQNVGVACVDEGREYGVHGGISATPAVETSVQSGWQDGEFRFSIRGKLREVTSQGLFGPDLVLERTISSALGSDAIRISDTITNEGFTASALMLLYHVNLGFSLLDDGGRILAPSRKVTPRDAAAAPGLPEWDLVRAPAAGYAEQVFFHEMEPDAKGFVRVALVAPERKGQPPLALCLAYRAAELPRFIQWKQLGAGAYVMGFEPANCLVMGRADERQRGTLKFLQPGERVTTELEVSVIASTDELARLEHSLAHPAKAK